MTEKCTTWVGTLNYHTGQSDTERATQLSLNTINLKLHDSMIMSCFALTPNAKIIQAATVTHCAGDTPPDLKLPLGFFGLNKKTTNG
jgi:hypothetical protein